MKDKSSDVRRSAAAGAGRGATPTRAQGREARARRNERLALLALAVMALIWGYNWVVLKKALAYVGPFGFSALRTVLGVVTLLLMLWAMRQSMRQSMDLRGWLRVLLLGILQTGAFSVLMQSALLQGGVGKTSILVYTMPFWVIPLAWVAFGERIRGLQWLALAMAVGGLVLVLEPWGMRGSYLSEVLAIGAGLSWGLATIVAKWIKRDYDMGVLQLTTWQMVFGAIALCAAAWVVPEKPIDPAPYFYVALAYNAVLATGLAWVLWLFALQNLSASMAGMASLGVPMVGVLSGWLELGERPGVFELSGMVLIGAALVLLSMRAVRRR
ncbi:DMT family transporter [Castellaniella sp. GW247-6E4]|uniref:DMT family transporter n=1 Tax=Castellaniella sp. GW247-6E4 TaxID=3140380 RepID=UPI0033160CDF